MNKEEVKKYFSENIEDNKAVVEQSVADKYMPAIAKSAEGLSASAKDGDLSGVTLMVEQILEELEALARETGVAGTADDIRTGREGIQRL